jgi:hypothetical protein
MGTMSSIISWLDYSEEDQRHARETIQFFSDKGTVDDLGIGTIRDAFSNALFPGTSIIQTRARYFLFVPWIYREAERRFPDRIAAKGSDLERRLIEALREGGDRDGLIGRDAGPNLKTLPSRIYWAGLAVHGIFRAPGLTIAAYARRASRGSAPAETENELAERRATWWDPEVPDPPADFFRFVPTNFELTRAEAEWLSERILSSDERGDRASLLSVLVRDLRRREALHEEENLWSLTPPPGTPDRLRNMIHHSERFSCAANGAAWLYNLMLAEKRSESGTATDATSPEVCRESFRRWCAWASSLELQRWAQESAAFRDTLRSTVAPIAGATQAFVERWSAIVANGNYEAIGDSENARQLILEREVQHKKAQARLVNKDRLAAWRGESGTIPLSYRWPLVRRILNDIASGLGASKAAGNAKGTNAIA